MKHLAGLFILISLAVNAQKAPIKFGDVSLDELKMVRYETDTSASAVVLADFGESSLDYTQGEGFDLNFERIRRVKILSKDGYEWGNFSIRLYKGNSDEEKLVGLRAVTYNLEKGKIVETKLKNDAIFREEEDKNVHVVKFALPNVKEGSVIEIAYRVKSPFLFNFQDWDFQSVIPIKWSEYRVHIPEYFHYKKFMQGYLPITNIPKKLDNRKTPVVKSMAYIDEDVIEISFPEDLYPEFIPQPIHHESKFGVYDASYKMESGKLLYSRKLMMNKGTFAPETYQELIDFYKNINKADNAKLVMLSKT